MTEPRSVLIDEDSINRMLTRLLLTLAYWVPLLFLAGAAFLAAVIASDSSSKHRFGWAVAGVFSTIMVLVLPAARHARSERSAGQRIAAAEGAQEIAEERAVASEEEAAATREVFKELQASFNSSIGDIISPICTRLAGLESCGPTEAVAERAACLQQIVDAARTLCGGDGVRAAIYVLGQTHNGKNGDLQRACWSGRQDPPRPSFTRKNGDSRERAVHDLVKSGGYDLQEDVLEMPDKILYRTKRYRSFVATSVTAGSVGKAMLAVDAPEVARFDRTHLGILLALAGLTAIALGAPAQRVPVDNPGEGHAEE